MRVELPDPTLLECGEIAVTAMEGGIGYWAVADSYDWRRWDPEGTDCSILEQGDRFVFYSIIEDTMGDAFDPWLYVTPSLIKRGYQMVLEGGVRRDLAEQALSCILEHEAGAVDADVADCIIQLGAFGEIVYG